MTLASPTTLEQPAPPPVACSDLLSVRLTHLDLFSGIGGFALAAQAAGFTTIGFSEIEPYACKILKRHWPDVPNHGDIRNIRGIRADLVTGGFPCQPYSLAGKRRGAADDRALWPEMLRVIAESECSGVLGENVAGIINMELDRVLADLESIGYAAWSLVIPACAVDARHRRDRVWIVAYSESNHRRRRLRKTGTEQNRNLSANGGADMADTIGGETHEQHQGCRRLGELGRLAVGRETETSRPPENEASANGTDRRREDVSDANGGQHNRSGAQRNQRHLENRNGEGNQQPCHWLPEPNVGRVADGIPNRSHRLKGLGNAIVPQVAETLIREMARTLNL